MKYVEFLGDSLSKIRDFPDDPRQEAGYQIDRLQRGLEPDHWKPMKTVGAGVREITIKEAEGAFRVIYIAHMAEKIVVLHAFQKKTEQTAQHDIDLAAQRLREFLQRRK
jgi:phage-related protein